MPETDPAITPRCASCGSDAMIPDVFAFITGGGTIPTFGVGLYANPSALLNKKRVTSEASYHACGDCGFIAMVAHDPGALWDAHVDRISRDF